MTGGPLLIFEYVGETAAKGLRDRRELWGELALSQSVEEKAKSGEPYDS
jgi:hypothetical protein